MRAILPAQSLEHGLGAVVADAGRRQLRAAETEKYPHVTYFLNGGREEPYAGEDRILVPSPKVATYDLQPEMSAPELTDKVVAAIESGAYDLIVLDYANPDMVGHTGSLPAAIHSAGGALIVIADHGNCELMRDPETGGPHTAHTTNPVPAILMGSGATSLADGKLADVAPTLLRLMDLPQPQEMTGKPLMR
jgi:2,3-bisphosphoglycerate-independent phosphoglycerate mutase